MATQAFFNKSPIQFDTLLFIWSVAVIAIFIRMHEINSENNAVVVTASVGLYRTRPRTRFAALV